MKVQMKLKAMTVQSKSSQTKFLTTSQFQQTETESKLTYVQFWTATFIKSTQVSNLPNVQNIGTQIPFISHVETKVLKMHSTQMGNTNTIGNKFPHMQKTIENGVFLKFLHILNKSDQLTDFIM